MSLQEFNKEVVRSYVAAFNRGDLQALKDLFASDAEVQGVFGTAVIEKTAAIWQQLIEGLGINLTIEELVAEGDRLGGSPSALLDDVILLTTSIKGSVRWW